MNNIGEQLEKGQHTGSGELKWLLLENVYPDPQQPRTLLSQLGINTLSVKEHCLGMVNLNDPKNSKKQEAFANLQALSETIAQHGLIQPISVHKLDKGGYIIEAGERRYLAHVLLGKSEIHAIVRAPQASRSKTLQRQLVENIGRDDLSLSEKIEALIELETLSQFKSAKTHMTKELSSLIGFSERQARKYVAVLQGPKELLDLVRSGRLRKLNDAAKIAVIDNKQARNEALKELLGPSNEKKNNEPIDAKTEENKTSSNKSKKLGISLGKATDVNTIKHVIECVVGDEKYKNKFAKIDWSDDKSAMKAWRLFWNALETNHKGE